jgi:hypothetical protein
MRSRVQIQYCQNKIKASFKKYRALHTIAIYILGEGT